MTSVVDTFESVTDSSGKTVAGTTGDKAVTAIMAGSSSGVTKDEAARAPGLDRAAGTMAETDEGSTVPAEVTEAMPTGSGDAVAKSSPSGVALSITLGAAVAKESAFAGSASGCCSLEGAGVPETMTKHAKREKEWEIVQENRD